MFFVVAAMLAFDFYPITSVMIILLAVLNDLPIMTIAYDNTWLDPKPARWNMHRVLYLSTTLGLIGVVETFLLLAIAKLWLGLNIPQLQAFIFLKLAVAGHVTLLVVRTKKSFLSKPYPAKILTAAIISTPIIASLIVGYGIFMSAIPWSYIALIWVYCIIWAFIEDWAKLEVYKHLNLSGKRHKNFLDILKTPLHAHGSN
jgi:H+-transporting ATPase